MPFLIWAMTPGVVIFCQVMILQTDIFKMTLNVLKYESWDLLMVAHPPCTRLCNSGVRWLDNPPPNKTVEQMYQELDEGASLFSDLWNCEVPHLAMKIQLCTNTQKQGSAILRNNLKLFNLMNLQNILTPKTMSLKRTCLWLRNCLY